MFGIRVALAALAIVAVMVAACGEESESDIATKAAKDWVDRNIDRAADEIVALLIGEAPIVSQIASDVLAGQIRRNVNWTYSTPSRRIEYQADSWDTYEAKVRYDVTATATVELTLSLPMAGPKTYTVSLPFDLEVKTETRSAGGDPDRPSGTVREVE